MMCRAGVLDTLLGHLVSPTWVGSGRTMATVFVRCYDDVPRHYIYEDMLHTPSSAA